MTVSASVGGSVSGNVYVPQEPEHFGYDADGNLTNDGRWSYVWDGESRLIQNDSVNKFDLHGLVVLLAAHPVISRPLVNHSFVILIPDDQCFWNGIWPFNRGYKTSDGKAYATIGAGPGGFLWTWLISGIDRPEDVKLGTVDYSTVIAPPHGKSDSAFIIWLLQLNSW
jgi:hypothetical protein